MASTSVHLPGDLAHRLEELARRKGISRNRLIVEAVESLLERERGFWTEDFFSNDHLTPAELRELHREESGWIESIRAVRRSKRSRAL